MYQELDEMFDRIKGNLSDEQLEQISRGPAQVPQITAPQVQSESTITGNAKVLPLEYPDNYSQQLPQSAILKDNTNRALEKRQQDIADLSSNANESYQRQAGYQDRLDQLSKEYSKPLPQYQRSPELMAKLKQVESQQPEQMPERDLLSEAIISFSPVALGLLGGETGAIAAAKAAPGIRENYEKQRKEKSEGISARNKLLAEKYEKLLKVDKDAADLWLSQQKLTQDQKKGLVDMAQFGVSTAQKDANQAQNLAAQASQDFGKTVAGSSEKLAELETIPMKEANKQKRATTIATGKDFKDETTLRKELNDLKETKDLKIIEVAFSKMKKAVENPSPAGDMSIVFGAYNAWDPSSTVREGEYDRALKATGLPDQIRNAMEKVRSGKLLTPEQRADFLEQARNSYNSQWETASRAQQSYIDIANRAGLNSQNVAPSGVSPQIKKELSSEDKQALEWANKNPKDPRAIKIKQGLGM